MVGIVKVIEFGVVIAIGDVFIVKPLLMVYFLDYFIVVFHGFAINL